MISAEKSNYLQDIHFDNPEEFLQGISPNGNLYHLLSNDYLFRGHARDDYKLPQSSSLFLLEHLRKLGYSEAKIFPGHRSVANEIINSIRFQYD